jgi:hypothetical protein
MFTNENSQRNKGREKVPAMGRPRTAPPGAALILGFKVPDSIIKALDEEAQRMTQERGLGASPVSRTEVIRTLIVEGLAARAKARAEHSKPRQ